MLPTLNVPLTREESAGPPSLKRIVTAVDLTPHSATTARYAADFARSVGASLVLVHVYPDPNGPGVKADERNRQAAERALADLTAMLRENGHACESAFLVGEPAAQVAAVAGNLDADLIVTASHHPSVLGQLFNRDQAPRIIHRAPCSVLVYHGSRTSAGTTPLGGGVVRRVILAPVDVMGEPAPTLEFAAALAQKWDADLHVLYVFSAPEAVGHFHFPQGVQGAGEYRNLVSARLLEWVHRLQPRHPRTFPLFEDDQSPVDCIQETARKLHADLIVIGAHDNQGGGSWFLPCSDVDGIARRAEAPVLVFRPKMPAP
ncbi:MAG TPA: universal stress protein [Chthoniobacterales bacterium]